MASVSTTSTNCSTVNSLLRILLGMKCKDKSHTTIARYSHVWDKSETKNEKEDVKKEEERRPNPKSKLDKEYNKESGVRKVQKFPSYTKGLIDYIDELEPSKDYTMVPEDDRCWTIGDDDWREKIQQIKQEIRENMRKLCDDGKYKMGYSNSASSVYQKNKIKYEQCLAKDWMCVPRHDRVCMPRQDRVCKPRQDRVCMPRDRAVVTDPHGRCRYGKKTLLKKQCSGGVDKMSRCTSHGKMMHKPTRNPVSRVGNVHTPPMTMTRSLGSCYPRGRVRSSKNTHLLKHPLRYGRCDEW